ncbi:bifunctional folylpolyglutamate synthase/dihydrofolate synthase [Desulfogranum japonicum]|uniref:bifunctional folylpolyglutamate synthase/dihydrofolate synthase n=1 Tax=Desulfogranum japonicum TaxID=231447 RepID=UPI000408977E|nr:folylpolyglutamate synthase/dihydrofolate synthase family protein [Desulfogranum japonicum]
MEYDIALEYLNNLQMFTIKLGLEAETTVLAKLGSPQNAFPSIHIAGTNGKGSVGATLMTLLAASGYRVGFYSSPHLNDIRERFQINGEYISRQEFASLIQQTRHTLGEQTLTYFECTTAVAFLWFAQKEVDIAVIETGLGGRLDATNVIAPLISVITNVHLDHQQHLGNTITEIAREKAGIIKHGIPLVTGNLLGEADAVIESRCQEKQSKRIRYQQDFFAQQKDDTLIHYQGFSGNFDFSFSPALCGKHQIPNTAVALATLEELQSKGFSLSPSTLLASLPLVRWPGRMELINAVSRGSHYIPVLIDGAHNEAGIEALYEELQTRQYQRLIVIWGSMRDKKTDTALKKLLQHASIIVYTQAEPVRSAKPDDLKEQTPPSLQNKVYCSTDVNQALDHAFKLWEAGDLICIAGSLYLVGKMRSLLLNKSQATLKDTAGQKSNAIKATACDI